jgi:hypothetical protein
LQQGKLTAGNHRWPHLARLFEKHRDQITGKDWARFYERHVEGPRLAVQAAQTSWGPGA